MPLLGVFLVQARVLRLCAIVFATALARRGGGLNAGEVVLQRGEEVADDRHTPRAAQQSLTGEPAHVRDIRIVHWKAEYPLHFCAPENVFLSVHHDGQQLVLALFDGVGLCGDGLHFAELGSSPVLQAVLQLRQVRSQWPVHARQVPPKIAGAVSCRHILGINHHRVTLQETRDVTLIVDAHGGHVLKEPEEGTLLPLLGLGLVQKAVELEEQSPRAFCTRVHTRTGTRGAHATHTHMQRKHARPRRRARAASSTGTPPRRGKRSDLGSCRVPNTQPPTWLNLP